MKFTKKLPVHEGYCWYVSTEYPNPEIGYVSGSVFFDTRWNRYPEDSLYRDKFLRFGEPIEKPRPVDNEIET